MQYTKLGNTDIEVSKICLGTMTWGYQNTQEEAYQQMDYALDNGVNFWDTAEMYAVPSSADTYGATETIIGNYFTQNKSSRSKVIIATKVAGPGPEHVRDGKGATAESITQAIEGSLKRLQTDYIDLYQIHWPSRKTNTFSTQDYNSEYANKWLEKKEDDKIEEALEALSKIVKEGKVRTIGVSNETPWGLHKFLTLSNDKELPRIVSIQNTYSLLSRAFDVGLAEFSLKEHVGLLAYSPLAGGILSGKYRNNQMPEGARFSTWGQNRMKQFTQSKAYQVVDEYYELANKYELSLTQLALAWVNQRPWVTSSIIGATTVEQLKENIASIDVELTPEILELIGKIHTTTPNSATI